MGEKSWSLNTSIRNPDRIPEFFYTLNDFDGKLWINNDPSDVNTDKYWSDVERNNIEESAQEDYYIKLIQHKVVKCPSGMRHSQDLQEIYNSSLDFSEDQAREIAVNARFTGGLGLRARHPFSVISNLGLVSTENKRVKITDLGKRFIKGELSEDDVFMNYMLKLQGPIPGDRTFNDQNGFDVRFLPAVIYFIYMVNKKWESIGNNPIGIADLDEFGLFIPFLKKYNRIDEMVDELIDYRKELRSIDDDELRKEFIKNKKKERIGFDSTTTLEEIDTQIRSFGKDYADNIFRYLRKTKYFRLRGYKSFDLNEAFIPQLEYMIKDKNQLKPILFKNAKDYKDYMIDLDSYHPPWTETEAEKALQTEKELILQARKSFCEKATDYNYLEKTAIRFKELVGRPDKLYENELANEILFNSDDLPDYKGPPIDISKELEFRIYASIASINDAIEIEPTYNSSADLVPRSFTSSVPDLTSKYRTFGLVTEVTNQESQNQWKNEPTSVVDHYYNFCTENNNVENFCIFIAPSIHNRTYQDFFTYSKYNNFDDSLNLGIDLNIIPLTFNQWSKLLMYFVEVKKNNTSDDHKIFKEILSKFFVNDNISNVNSWKEHIENTVNNL